MKQKLRLFMSMLLMAVCSVTWGQITLTQLQSIDEIDEEASYVLGLDGTGFHYEGTSSWGKTALLKDQSPLFYTLTIAEDGESFTAMTDIDGTLYYLQIPTSNTFSMTTSKGPNTNTDIIIGTTQVSGENYAVANKNTTTRHLRINGTSGLRSYAGTTGTMAYFYKYSESTTPSISFETKSVTIGTSSTYTQIAQTYNADNAEVTYSSDNAEVATVNASTGKVSVGTNDGTATITASMSVNGTTYTDYYEITVISIEDGVFDFSLGYDYGSGLEESQSAIRYETTWTARNVTLKPTGNYAFFTDNTLRIYSGGSFSVSVPEGYEITKIVFLGSRNLNKMSPDTGELTGTGTESTWTGTSQIVTFTRTTDNPYYSKITVSYQEKSNKETATVEINRNELILGDNEANSATITTDPIGLDVDYESSDDEIASVSDEGVVTATGAGTANITVSWAAQTIDGTEYADGSKMFSVTVSDPNAPGTANNPYTVAQARAAIDAGTGVTGVYAKGIVSGIVTAYNPEYGNISYNISADGETTSDQLQAYRGKSYEGANFTSADDIQVGDEVVIYGNLKNYNGTYEFDANNKLVTLIRKAQPTITINPSELNLEDATTAEITVSPAGFVVSTYSSSDDEVATVSDDGVVTAVGAGTATITVSWAAQTIDGTEYEAGSEEITMTVVDPNAPGTENNPYTVAQARAAIDAGTGVTGVYAKGIVSGIVTSYNSQYGNISYNISADGETTSDQLQAYRGKSYNGAAFTSADDIQVGDEVVIYGNLIKFRDTYEFAEGNQLVSLVRSEKANATVEINKTELNLAVENEKTATITVTPAGLKNLSYSSSSEDVATVSDGTVTAIAEGETTITVSWDETEIEDVVYKSGEKTFVITVIDNAPVKCVFEEDYYTRFDFTKNGWGLPTTKTVDEGEFTNSGKTIKLAGTTGGGYSYYDNQHYLLNGKNGAYLTLPDFDFDVMAIEVTGKNGASGKVTQNIFVDDEDEDKAVSTETTGATGTNLYFIDENYQSAGNIYTIKVTNDYNTQFTEIKVYKKDAFVELSVSDAGYRTYCDADALNFNVASDGLKAYIVEGVDAEGSTNLVLKEVGKVPAETGVLLEAEEGTYYVAKEAVKAEEEETEPAYDNVSTNKLIGVTEAKVVEPSIIVLMKGENGVGFYKTSKTFTVGAHTAYLPLSILDETVASTEGDGVKLMNLYGTDEDTPTGITVINAGQQFGKDAVIYNLSGQRVSRVVKGMYIVNGKKVMVK